MSPEWNHLCINSNTPGTKKRRKHPTKHNDCNILAYGGRGWRGRRARKMMGEGRGVVGLQYYNTKVLYNHQNPAYRITWVHILSSKMLTLVYTT